MSNFWQRLFGKKTDEPSSGDMRVTPVDNPLDYRADGSIREGDPAWDFMMSLMDSGQGGIAVQREDGTWDTSTFDVAPSPEVQELLNREESADPEEGGEERR